jgi:hypothetical protein
LIAAQNAKEHRRWHRRWSAVAEPEPNAAVKRLKSVGGLIEVNRTSPLWLNKAVYERARLFCREFGYDFAPWYLTRPTLGPDEARAFLFVADDAATLAGACAFFREPGGWSMHWVWLAPTFRGRGILTRHRPQFRSLFGAAFYLEQPLSEAMTAFVQKQINAEERNAHGNIENIARQ